MCAEITKWVSFSLEAVQDCKKKAKAARRRQEVTAKKKAAKEAMGSSTGEKRKEGKAKKDEAESDVTNGETDESTMKKPKLAPKITVYIHIDPLVPANQLPKSKLSAKPTVLKPLIKGPFFYTLGNEDFDSFQ
jgi:hypothetical protein